MAWIEVHQELPGLFKTQNVADALDLPPVHVVGHLVALWLWALDNAQHGRVSVSERAIAQAAQWLGDPHQFVEALVTCGGPERKGFLERDGRVFVLHDWDDYAGRLEDSRKRNRDRMREERKKKKEAARAKALCDARAEHVSDTCALGAQLPYRTVPNKTDDDDTPLNPPTNLPPDDRVDDTPARRQVVEAYARLVDRAPHQVSSADLQAITNALEAAGGEPAPLLLAIDTLTRLRRETGKPPSISSFKYVLRVVENDRQGKKKGGSKDHGTRGGAAPPGGEYDDGEYTNFRDDD